MSENYLKIVEAGLIGEDSRKGPFRQIVVKDTNSGRKSILKVYKKERPSLWSDIEKIEQGKDIPSYRGKIVKHKSMDTIVFDGENTAEAFENQKQNAGIVSKITYRKAEALRLQTFGYITNLTKGRGIEISWRKIDKKASLVKFRHYKSKGVFSWTLWYEIEN